MIDEPTRIPSNTLLDVILTNSSASILKHGVLDPLCSGHKPIHAFLNTSKHSPTVFKRLVWNFNDANFDLFRSELLKIDWDNVINSHDDIDASVESFTDIFMNIAKQCLPNKICTIRGKDKP